MKPRRPGQPLSRSGMTRACGAGACLLATAPWFGGSAALAAIGGVATVVKAPSGGPLASGGSATEFSLKLPDHAACTRDSTHGGYRLQSYLVPGSVALDTLRFGGSGPVKVPGEFRAPLYDDGGSQFASKLTAAEVAPGGPGEVIQPVATFSFMTYTSEAEGFPLPPGAYNLGIACTLGSASDTQLDKYWNAVVTVTPDPDDRPAQIRWMAAPPTESTTSATSPRPLGVILAAIAASAALGAAFTFRRRGTRRSRAHQTQPLDVKESR